MACRSWIISTRPIVYDQDALERSTQASGASGGRQGQQPVIQTRLLQDRLALSPAFDSVMWYM
jgi:hypothetical protein